LRECGECGLLVKTAGEQGAGEQGAREMAKKEPIQSHEDLEVYQIAFDAAMKIFAQSKKFPTEEKYSLTDQIRRSSRSVCANLAEAWRKRRYQAAFVAKLNDCEAEAAETQTWVKFAVKCNYLDVETGRELYGTYNRILGILVTIINNPSPWILK
jgi:four helix bundle protein